MVPEMRIVKEVVRKKNYRTGLKGGGRQTPFPVLWREYMHDAQGHVASKCGVHIFCHSTRTGVGFISVCQVSKTAEKLNWRLSSSLEKLDHETNFCPRAYICSRTYGLDNAPHTSKEPPGIGI